VDRLVILLDFTSISRRACRAEGLTELNCNISHLAEAFLKRLTRGMKRATILLSSCERHEEDA